MVFWQPSKCLVCVMHACVRACVGVGCIILCLANARGPADIIPSTTAAALFVWLENGLNLFDADSVKQTYCQTSYIYL